MNAKVKLAVGIVFCVILIAVIYLVRGQISNLSSSRAPNTATPPDLVSQPAQPEPAAAKKKVPFLHDDKNDPWGGGPSGNARLYNHIDSFETYLKKAVEELGAYDSSSKFVEKYNSIKQENEKEYDVAHDSNDRNLLLKYKDKLERLMDEAVPELEIYEKSGKNSEALAEFRGGVLTLREKMFNTPKDQK